MPQGGKLSRKDIDDYTQFVAIYGAKGLAYIKVNERTPSMNTDLSIIRSRLYHLWKEIGAHYKRTEGQERATIIKMGILSARTWEDLDALYDVLDEYLDEKRLTRFDTKKDIDTTDVEAENEDAEN